MLKKSNYFYIFLLLLFTFSASILFLLYKFFPLTFKHTIYYCQAFLSSISFQIPHKTLFLFWSILAAIISFSLVKFFLSYLRILTTRRGLVKLVGVEEDLRGLLKKLELSDKVVVVKSKKVFAFCLGVVSPKIYLSTQLFLVVNEDELEAILLHEKYHLENKDTLTLFIAHLVKSFLPFFPVISDLVRNYKTEKEIKADQAVISALRDKRPLISVLHKVIKESPKEAAFVPAITDKETLEVRIRFLLENKLVSKRFSFKRLGLSAISITIAFVLINSPVQAVEIHNHEEEVVMICLQGSDCSSWCKSNKSVVPQTSASTPLLFTPASSSH